MKPGGAGNDRSAQYPVAGEEYRAIILGRKLVVLPEDNISLTSPVKPKKVKKYIKSSSVPLSDFSKFMTSLASRFHGSLSSIKSSVLKQLTLPVVVPQSVDLPEFPDHEAGVVVVVNHKNWHGVILAREIKNELSGLQNFKKGKNGDILGTGTFETQDAYVMDVVSLLNREGFLTMIDEPDW